MEFGAATATLTKKLSNGYGVSGRSAYDGVFATPIKLRTPSFSSQFEDYCEIFGGSGASLGSSIPILELPELNERRTMDDVRRSKLDYSKVFGGFGNLDAAVPFQEMVAEPKENDSFTNGASARCKVKGGNQSCQDDCTSTNYSKEIPVVSRSSNGTKRINMSYHKVNQGSENGTNVMTHIAQLQAVPAYTCLVEEVNSVKMNKANNSIPVAQDAYSGSHCNEGIKEGGHCTKSFIGPSPANAKKQSSNSEMKVKNRSDSIDLFFDACEISNGCNETHHVKFPPSEAKASNLDNHNGDTMRSMATKCQASKSGPSEGASCADSPSYVDDMIDSNSEAAASVAALRKAIEEAQVRIKVAKESMRRKKEGFPDRVKRKSNIDVKAEGKKETKLAYKTMKHEEINTGQTFGEMDALPQVSSGLGKPTMRNEQVRSDLGAKEMCVAKEAVQEAQKKLKSTQVEHKEEVKQKTDHKGKVLELKEAENNREMLYIKTTGRNVYEKPEESDHTTEVVKEYWEQENNEEKVCGGSEARAFEELVHEPNHGCQVVDETKVIQETHDNRTTDKRLKVNEDGEVENKVMSFHELEDYESNLGGQGLIIENEFFFAFKPEEEGEEVEGSFEQEECKKNLRPIQELGEVEKNIVQEQKRSEDKVEVSSKLEECELTEFLEPIDNERQCSPHRSDFINMEKIIENLGCVEERKRKNESGFLYVNQEREHSCQREAAENMLSNVYVGENIVDHIHYEEEIYERITEDCEFDENERIQDVQASGNELEGATILMEENDRERKDNKEPEVIRATRTDPNYEEIKAKEAGKTTNTCSIYEPDVTEKLRVSQVADTIIENDEALEVTPEVYSCENHEEPESVQEADDFSEKHAVETSAFIQDALELSEAVNQMQDTFETVSFEGVATNIGETDIKVRQNEDQCLEKAENDCNLATLVEETTPEAVEICKDAKEARVALNEEIDENQSISSNEENLFDNEHNIEASQIPSTSEWKSSPFKEDEVKSIHSNLKESDQVSMTMDEKEANGNSQKLELEKEHLKKIDEAKERQREREKEKLAVERAIREARERAFADARERATLERAAAEARQKNISDGRERLGKTNSQANDKTRAEKAAMEAKLKAERAAVERATAEARARALERALSEKAASEARNKSDKSVAEKGFGASRDNGMKQNFHSKSFSYGVRDSTDVFNGADGDSAQRCKARSERHQRIGERVAKALAEKNMHDLLVQKEQQDKNRLAEALDADVKRWSSGKAGNLRALLSTLQYILGPDSGWQPIPLTDIVTNTAVKKAYRKATLLVHPDKLQQRGASTQQKYICEKVFDLLKEAWNRFNMEER
ncbi:auxilin-like protein 1 isoform X2 [Gastrolobium bilobum]|uniref:auxilin-like protein 1 isoform X2 n=1 Tax=Gastrolobium bilobum TaxID=150636 RepID=UPI002AB08AE9|nr:auxilin-like protein 1 isoform X2 [Gastrolobium bilobum]